MELLSLEESAPLWLEDESITIGRIVMPKPLYDRMQASPTIVLEVPKQQRVQKLAEEYCRTDKALLESAILSI